jgi:hypothetical protein
MVSDLEDVIERFAGTLPYVSLNHPPWKPRIRPVKSKF